MRKTNSLCILMGFILLFAVPLLAQEAVDEITVPDEEAAAGGWADEGVLTGDVISLDLTAGTITIKSEDGADKTFAVVDGETILWKGIEDIELASINKGEKAEVGYYTDESGKLIASWVDILVEEEAAPVGIPAETTDEETSEEDYE